MTRIFVPRDAAALAVGADEVAAALAGHADVVRTGSRGMFWLEPMIEVETPEGRIAYGPVEAGDVPGLLADGLLTGAAQRLRLGVPEAIPFLARQTRLTFALCGIVDPLSLDDYRAHGGMVGLEKARALGPAATVETVLASGLRGRGGAGFPTGIKWKTVAEAKGDRKFIVCNADEGDSGTYADRMLLEGDPFSLIEGMAIAGFAVGASKGYVYTRSEYPHGIATFDKALAIARRGRHPGGRVRYRAAGRCRARMSAARKPRCWKAWKAAADRCAPSRRCRRIRGCSACPTVINNLVTLATVPCILRDGAAAYQAIGMGRSRGTMPIQLAGNIRHGGLFEAGFGVTLGELVNDIGGGTLSGRPVRAVQVGGPLGAYFPQSLFDTPFDYEAFAAKDGLIGHGGVVVFDDTVDMAHQARFAMEFCVAESCGKCTPCRIGSVRGVETVDKILAGTQCRCQFGTVARSLPHDEVWIAVCAGRVHPLPRAERDEFLSGRFPRPANAWPQNKNKETP